MKDMTLAEKIYNGLEEIMSGHDLLPLGAEAKIQQVIDTHRTTELSDDTINTIHDDILQILSDNEVDLDLLPQIMECILEQSRKRFLNSEINDAMEQGAKWMRETIKSRIK